MITTWLYAIAAVLVVSLVSLIGILTLAIKEKIMHQIIIYLVSLSAGALLGGAFIHLIPEGMEAYGSSPTFFILILAGMLLFFIMEKAIIWHHCHDEKCEVHPFSYLNMIGDSIHNLIDGLVIGSSFAVDIRLGIVTTIVVILHEIPQEIGDFGILVYGGFSRARALFYNFLTGLTAIIGAIIAYFFNARISGATDYILAFAGGGFIYIACADLIPELHKERDLKKSLLSFVFFVLALLLMLFSAHK